MTQLYSAHTIDELVGCYETEGSNMKINFLEESKVAPLIYLLRSFHSQGEFDSEKAKTNEIAFDAGNTFGGEPIKYPDYLRSRLRGKFLATTRVVHCAKRSTLEEKETLFDSKEELRKVIDKFDGYFALVYTLWNQEMCDAVGMGNTRKLSQSYNPTDHITPHLLKMAESYIPHK